MSEEPFLNKFLAVPLAQKSSIALPHGGHESEAG